MLGRTNITGGLARPCSVGQHGSPPVLYSQAWQPEPAEFTALVGSILNYNVMTKGVNSFIRVLSLNSVIHLERNSCRKNTLGLEAGPEARPFETDIRYARTYTNWCATC